MLHLATGFAVYAVDRAVFRSQTPLHRGPREPIWLAGALFFALLPDLDAVAGILGGDMGRYHNQAFHSVTVSLLFAMLLAGLGTVLGARPAARAFRLATVGALIHLALDFITTGRGVMLLWPWTDLRFQSIPPLLRGLVWSEGLVSREHLFTFLQELPWTLGLLTASLLLLVPRTAKIRAIRKEPAP